MTKAKLYWSNSVDEDLMVMTEDIAEAQYDNQNKLGVSIIQGDGKGSGPFIIVGELPPVVRTESRAAEIKKMPDAHKAYDIMQMIGDHTDFEDCKEFKLFALEIAETLGPDHCQTLYRLAVLATKLA